MNDSITVRQAQELTRIARGFEEVLSAAYQSIREAASSGLESTTYCFWGDYEMHLTNLAMVLRRREFVVVPNERGDELDIYWDEEHINASAHEKVVANEDSTQ